jgi:hypothetical protein
MESKAMTRKGPANREDRMMLDRWFGWRDGDDPGNNIVRWIAGSYIFRFIMAILFMPFMLVWYGVAVLITEQLAPLVVPYVGEEAVTFMPLAVMFSPLIAWVWIR